MNILVVYTHPNHESLNYAFLQKTLEGIKANPNESQVQVVDLYKDDFDPRLTFDKENRRRDLHIHPETDKYREQIKWADHIVFIYPIWWGRAPALLLGYIDRLFVTNFAYKYVNNPILPEGLLKGKIVTCISTMKGPGILTQIFSGNLHRKSMKTAIFSFVGIKKVKFFEFGSMESKNGKHQKKLAKIKHYFQTI